MARRPSVRSLLRLPRRVSALLVCNCNVLEISFLLVFLLHFCRLEYDRGLLIRPMIVNWNLTRNYHTHRPTAVHRARFATVGPWAHPWLGPPIPSPPFLKYLPSFSASSLSLFFWGSPATKWSPLYAGLRAYKKTCWLMACNNLPNYCKFVRKELLLI